MSDDDDNSNVVSFVALAERDAEILAQRLAGAPIRQLAAKYRISDAEVLQSLDKSLPTLDAAARARYLRESLAQLDQLQSWWHERAQTSAAAAAIVLKVAERRAVMLGLDAPAHVRLDPVRLVVDGDPQAGESSTDALVRMLDHVVAEGRPKLVEHEAAPELPPSDGGPAS